MSESSSSFFVEESEKSMGLRACLLFVYVSGCRSSFCSETGWTPLWTENFNGSSLSSEAWNIEDGNRVGLCRSAYCSPSNVAVRDGALWLTSRREVHGSYNYTTAAVHTMGKKRFAARDGPFRVCVSAMLPGHASPPGAAQGLWPAIWMMPDDASCDPDEGETDILEQISGKPELYATYHWQTTWPKENCSYPAGHRSISNHALLPNWNATFHEYALERTLDYVAFVYDGVTVVNSSGSDALVWDIPFYLIINTAMGGSWPGEPNRSTVLPVTHTVNSVVVVRKI